MMIAVASLICCLFVAAGDSLSTDYPFLRAVSVQAVVTHDTSSQMFFYEYSIRNDSSSRGNLDDFVLDLWRNPSSIAYDTTGLVFMNRHSAWEFHFDYPRHVNDVVPVGLPFLPGDWEGSPICGNYSWASIHNFEHDLHPGDGVSGIVFMSRGLPGIRQFTADPDFNIDRFFPDLDDTSATMTFAQEDSIREAVKYHGLTVGPWAPPAKFDPAILIDTLKSFVRESQALGWISSREVADRYVTSFAIAWANINQSKLQAAIARLGLVLRQAESDRRNELKPEAYALIRFNTEYLKEKLQSTK